MTYKEKKETLEGYSSSVKRIVCLQRELEQWHTISTGITQKISPVIVNTNDNNSKVESCAIKCAEIEELILNEIKTAEHNRDQVNKIIEGVRDIRKRDLLTMRYINNVSVRKIAILYDADVNSIYKQLRRTITSLNI